MSDPGALLSRKIPDPWEHRAKQMSRGLPVGMVMFEIDSYT